MLASWRRKNSESSPVKSSKDGNNANVVRSENSSPSTLSNYGYNELNQVCRMSYLNLIGEGIFQNVLKGFHGILDRYQLMLEAIEVAGECLETHEPMTIQSLMLNEMSNVHDGMEISDGIGTSSEQVERMPELVTLSTGLHDDQQCPGSLEMFANLHSSPIEPRNSDISSRMDDESNNSGMLAATNIRPGRDSWRNLEVEDGELPQVQNGGGFRSGVDNSCNHSQRINGQIISDSDEGVDTDEEGDENELFDSTAMVTLIKIIASASSDSGRRQTCEEFNLDIAKRVVCDLNTTEAFPNVLDLKCSPVEPILISTAAPRGHSFRGAEQVSSPRC
ncbi:hypothetical protein VitviT2T_026774 [Vitis vinifera]|uniref:ATXR3 C-terminal domain-containing protein n=1 Tax=Vitis vinifera TaxID=29760 RepID=A0ABY9DPQ7_VITVI|nr:hypothetical protein VitviT2T_026774 [Vitis vinifera]